MYLEKVHYSSESKEWYTPAVYVRAVQAVLGCIDVDPASCVLANTSIQAKTFFTKEQNGLLQPWFGKVFLNPPYGRYGETRQTGEAQIWIEKLFDEYTKGNVEEAILLVQAEIYKRWFEPLWNYPLCFPNGRIAFWNAQGQKGRSPHASAFVYFGSRLLAFTRVFSTFGPILLRYYPED